MLYSACYIQLLCYVQHVQMSAIQLPASSNSSQTGHAMSSNTCSTNYHQSQNSNVVSSTPSVSSGTPVPAATATPLQPVSATMIDRDKIVLLDGRYDVCYFSQYVIYNNHLLRAYQTALVFGTARQLPISCSVGLVIAMCPSVAIYHSSAPHHQHRLLRRKCKTVGITFQPKL